MKEFDAIKSPITGSNLIEASAGTGKTYALSIIFLRLIVEKELSVENILAVTFTEAATSELRLKIRHRLKEALYLMDENDVNNEIKNEDKNESVSLLMKGYKGDVGARQRILTALKSFDQASIYTIHSFCRQLLLDNAFESAVLFGSEIMKDNDFIKQGAADQWRKNFYNSSESVVSYVMNNCSAGELVELYMRKPLSDNLAIKPDVPSVAGESIDRLYDMICNYYDELKEAWSVERDNIVEIFYKEKYLNGTNYRKESKGKWFDEMEEYIISDDPLNIFKNFEKFTADKLKTSLNTGNVYIENNLFDICQKLYSAYSEYKTFGSSFIVNMKRSFLDAMDELLLKEKSINNETSFNDLIKDAHRGLNGIAGKQLEEKIRGRYKAALIDEFQDTDDLQFEIFDRLFNNKETMLFLIGDPKQAIYRFRGADIFSYLKATDRVDNRYQLSNNWRSRGELIASVNEIFSRTENPFIYKQIEFYPAKPAAEDQSDRLLMNGAAIPAFGIWLEDEDNKKGKRLLERLAAEISLLINRDDDAYSLSGAKINPKDIAILVRTHRHGLAVRDALLEYNIPSVTREMDNVFESDDAQSLYFIVSAIADPLNLNFVKAALSTPIMGCSAGRLYEFNQGLSGGPDSSEDVTLRFFEYRNIWQKEGALGMISAFLSGESIPSRLFSMNGGDRMMTNINHLAEILHEREYKGRLAPKELTLWFGNAISNPPDGEEFSMRLERDDDAVNIMTMHACKGLEFPIVYCVFLGYAGNRKNNYIIYHDAESDNKPVMYIDKDADEKVKQIKKTEDLAEDVRLLYVALTRAKSACRLMFVLNRDFEKSAVYHVLFKGKDAGKLRADSLAGLLQEIADNSNGGISFEHNSIFDGKKYIAEKYPQENISVRGFTGKIQGSLYTHSYSSISKKLSREQDHDAKDFFSEYHIKNKKDDSMSFPAGVRSGSCIHEIFEKIDFTVRDKALVDSCCRDILLKYGFDQSWSNHIAEMFFNVVGSNLDDAGIKLSDIGLDSRLSELEFLFPMEGFDAKRFRDIFKDQDNYCNKIYERLADNYSDNGGMMKGFIDLVFVHGGKYYIADWKSNYIGDEYNDYIQDRLEEEMDKHNYYLQYYIYTTALNRYLSHRLADYSYEKHIGGVFYFFVRGMNSGGSSRTGIFIDRPKEGVIEKLDKYFSGEY